MKAGSWITVFGFFGLAWNGNSAPTPVGLFNYGHLTKLKIRECGRKHRTKAIQIQTLALPVPISIPGPIPMRLRANVTRIIPNNVNVTIKLKKRVFNFYWGPPNGECWFGVFGNCNYPDLQTCAVTKNVLNMGCPLTQKFYDINQILKIEEEDGREWRPGFAMRALLPGHYKALVKIKHPVTRELLACVRGKFEISLDINKSRRRRKHRNRSRTDTERDSDNFTIVKLPKYNEHNFDGRFFDKMLF